MAHYAAPETTQELESVLGLLVEHEDQAGAIKRLADVLEDLHRLERPARPRRRGLPVIPATDYVPC